MKRAEGSEPGAWTDSRVHVRSGGGLFTKCLPCPPPRQSGGAASCPSFIPMETWQRARGTEQPHSSLPFPKCLAPSALRWAELEKPALPPQRAALTWLRRGSASTHAPPQRFPGVESGRRLLTWASHQFSTGPPPGETPSRTAPPCSRPGPGYVRVSLSGLRGGFQVLTPRSSVAAFPTPSLVCLLACFLIPAG